MSPSDYSDMLSGIAMILTLSVSGIFVYAGVKFVNARTKKQEQVESPGRYDADAIARLQASVDAISIEVERISEGQRFTTRLMNERIPEHALLPESREAASAVRQ